VTEGLTLAAAAKAAVTEYFSDRGVFPDDNPKAGLASPASIKGNAVTSVTVLTNGRIQIQYDAKLDNSDLVLTPSTAGGGSVVWSCTDGTLLSKYRPANCRP
jgi:type IV pilus assembly protein PilA